MTIHPIHPIEAESYRIMADRVDLSGFGPIARAVVARMIHASADLDYARTAIVPEEAARAGVDALRRGAPVVVDAHMVRVGIVGTAAICALDEVPVAPPAQTRAAAALRLAAERHPDGAVFVVGNAPTALLELLRLAEAGAVRPALVIGIPVGFVGAAESKAMLAESGHAAITNIGEKGGSAVAAAALNALGRLARSPISRGEP